MNIKVMYSKNTDDWKTPTKIYNYFMKMGCIDYFQYQSKQNEFEKTYKKAKLYINPPFSKLKEIPKWIKKQLINDNTIYLLIPARTDTKYFHELLDLNPIITFIKGRLKYNDTGSAPFPTILLQFNKWYMYKLYNKKEQWELEYEN